MKKARRGKKKSKQKKQSKRRVRARRISKEEMRIDAPQKFEANRETLETITSHAENRERWQQMLAEWIKAGKPKIEFSPAPAQLFLAKLVSRSLEGYAPFIYAQAQLNKKQFFIELGRCLDREVDTELFSPKDVYLATLFNENEHISYKEAAAKMEKLDPEMTEAEFNMRKMRFRRYAQDLRKLYYEFRGAEHLL